MKKIVRNIKIRNLYKLPFIQLQLGALTVMANSHMTIMLIRSCFFQILTKTKTK